MVVFGSWPERVVHTPWEVLNFLGSQEVYWRVESAQPGMLWKMHCMLL